MMQHLSFFRMQLFTASVLLIGLTIGCGPMSRYPKELRYPIRKDVLVTEKPKSDVRQLPSPGQLDASVQKTKDLGANLIDPNEVSMEKRQELRKQLDEAFGTPYRPLINMEYLAVASTPEIENLQVDPRSLAKGSELYRRHCMHCHGISGDGRGPTGPWVHPHPRDYRQGTFKFISSIIPPDPTVKKPRRSDLLRTLVKGIEGSSMPAFGLLPEEELQLIVGYVIHLSIRGEVEFKTLRALAEAKGGEIEGGIDGKVKAEGSAILGQWAESTALGPNTPPAYPYDDSDKTAKAESVRRGYKLFIGGGICITCHYDFGRQSNYKFDDWGTLVRPANLTVGNYRGGRRPLDIYYRISGGIPPSGMPAFDPMKAIDPKLTGDAQTKAKAQAYWDLVNFVQALPYPAMLPKDVRDKVYGSSLKPAAKESIHASR